MGDLIGTLDVKRAMEINLAGTTYDTLLSSLVTAASNAIDQRCQREFVSSTVATRTFAVRRHLVDLAPYDLRSSQTPTVILHPESTGQTLTVDSDYLLLPQGGARLGGSYQQVKLSTRLNLASTLAQNFGVARVTVGGTWGVWAGTANVDATVARAAILTCTAWMDRAVAEYAIDDGREVRPDRFTTWAIPAAAWSLLTPWARLGTP